MVTPPLRIVFFGTPEFAVPTLNALLASHHTVTGVVTQPDRPRGRGQRLQPSPVKEVAQAHSLTILQPERLRDAGFLKALVDLHADLGVVAAYGKILTDAVLSVPRLGLINVHASLLPKYRGAAPIHRAVMAGETETGVTIMRVVRELDAGPTLSAVSRPLEPEETSVDVELDLARIGAGALVSAVDALSTGSVQEVPQDDTAATYARKIEKTDGAIDWSASAIAIHNQIRGLHPWPHAYAFLEGERCLLLESRVDGPRQAFGGEDTTVVEPGTIVEAHGDRLCVSTGEDALRLMRLQMEGRRPVSAREFLAGRQLRPGAKFLSSRPGS
jgi:methionyl-tRNA formyltransferase